jgi:mannose/cellobiose epimerase-like protein (N-acyl-D-glucosamine 2-epimerase family)
MQFVAQFADAASQTAGFGNRPLKQRHGRPHGGFRSKARQTRKLVHKRFKGFGHTFVHNPAA